MGEFDVDALEERLLLEQGNEFRAVDGQYAAVNRCRRTEADVPLCECSQGLIAWVVTYHLSEGELRRTGFCKRAGELTITPPLTAFKTRPFRVNSNRHRLRAMDRQAKPSS